MTTEYTREKYLTYKLFILLTYKETSKQLEPLHLCNFFTNSFPPHSNFNIILYMPYSLEVHFDDHTNATIQEMWKVLSKNKIPCRALEKGFSPHITLVYGEITGDKKVNWDFLANQKSFEFEFNALAAFPDRGVLFLSPEKSNLLSELHKIHDTHAKFSSMNKFYRTDLWEPHCSLASRLKQKQLEKCVRLFEDFKFPIKATCVSSNFVKYPKAEVLSSFKYLPE